MRTVFQHIGSKTASTALLQGLAPTALSLRRQNTAYSFFSLPFLLSITRLFSFVNPRQIKMAGIVVAFLYLFI